jgi:hypothetical protein
MRRIDRLGGYPAHAVQAAIRTIGIEPGEPIDLPNARPETPYQVQKPADPAAPVIVYRRTQPEEQGDYLVVSLMTREEYRQQKLDEQSEALRDPAVRRDIAVGAGTAASLFVEHHPEVVAPSPGEWEAFDTDKE